VSAARIRVRSSDWFAGPWQLYEALGSPVPRVLLESARSGVPAGRYSILAEDPFLIFRYKGGLASLSGPRIGSRTLRTDDPLTLLQKLLRTYRSETSDGLPPFASGAIGYLSYECKDWLLPRCQTRLRSQLELPEAYFLFFDRSIVWDHQKNQMLFCQADLPDVPGPRPSLENWERECRAALSIRKARSSVSMPAEEPCVMDINCSMRQDEYEEAVRRIQSEIRSGEIFQANLAHRFEFALPQGAREAYRRLREVNPSPFFGLLEAEDFEIVSGSPERLLRLEGRALETRPIAGTRRRGKDRRQDEDLSTELLLSEKERAEHVMLVDLERNDLGRVCAYGSVHVDEFLTLEDYSHVKHIVSNVRGTLQEGSDAIDALRAFFPGGTITGAPKIRCMQIIDEVETVPRGPYTGSLGYLSFAGGMDFNILIRSLVVKDGRATLHVGAGIVADSDPEKEYHETLYKAEAVLQAVFGAENVHAFFRDRGLAARVS